MFLCLANVNEMIIEISLKIDKCVFLTEAQQKVLEMLLKKHMHSNVDSGIKFFNLLHK